MDLFDIAIAKKLAGGGGVTPTGNINITSTAQTDVSAYATAQVVDADLVASNIKKDVDILGVVGTYEGGGGGGSSNVVTGTFKGTENGVLEVPIPYTGTGYPLSIQIYVKDGIDSSDTAFSELVCQNTMAQWAGSKHNPMDLPTYTDGTTIPS